jgi:hypothetical protein
MPTMARPQIPRRSRKLAARKNQAFSSVVMERVYLTISPERS